MDTHNILFAFLLTLIAGLSTGIGSFIALIAKRSNTKFLCTSLGFSAGVMIYVSFMEMLPTAKAELCNSLHGKWGDITLLLAFFLGIILIALIDFVIPQKNNPHEAHTVEEMNTGNKKILHRMGIMVAISISVHNFPEGVASFTAALGNLSVALPITLAIALHNIPEGIAVSVPIYHATGSRHKAFWFSFLSGLAEPLGALVAYLFLLPFWSPLANGIVLAAVAGIMVYISLDELLPMSEKFGEHHLSIIGVLGGMAVMAISLLCF
ncbi:MAG: zinc transporter ZupT [Bacteroidales bacterium]